LRERLDDLPSLVHHFLQKKCSEQRLSSVPSLAVGALQRLLAYTWPGNVRELQNVIERALILSPEGPLDFVDLLPQAEAHPRSRKTSKSAAAIAKITLEVPTFDKLADEFMATYAATNNRPSENAAKNKVLRVHLRPALGSSRLEKTCRITSLPPHAGGDYLMRTRCPKHGNGYVGPHGTRQDRHGQCYRGDAQHWVSANDASPEVRTRGRLDPKRSPARPRRNSVTIPWHRRAVPRVVLHG
jgi:hypothetical protein